MKYLIFIRGTDLDLRKQTVTRLMASLNPDINHVRAIRVGMSDYGPFKDKGERKAAASSVKKLVRKLMSGSHQEQFIIIDNPNLNPTDWTAMFSIADEVKMQVLGVGIDVRKNEQTPETEGKNENDPNVHLFNAMMYKYEWVENDQDIDLVIDTISKLNN